MTKAKAEADNRRRGQIANACQSCRASKVKCSGNHPTCDRCGARGTECLYDVPKEGITKRKYLRQKHFAQQQDLESATKVLNVLRYGSDQEATETLARLRMGMSVDPARDDLLDDRGSKPDHVSTAENYQLPAIPSRSQIDGYNMLGPQMDYTSAVPGSSSDLATCGTHPHQEASQHSDAVAPHHIFLPYSISLEQQAECRHADSIRNNRGNNDDHSGGNPQQSQPGW